MRKGQIMSKKMYTLILPLIMGVAVTACEKNVTTLSAAQNGSSISAEDKFIRDFNELDLNNISVKTQAELPDSLKDSGWCLEIANIPEANITIYGYISDGFGFRGVLINRENILYHFPDIYFTSPQLQLPKVSWNEDQQLLIMSCHNMTGTSLSADELIVFSFNDPEDVQSFSFSQKSLESQIKQNLSFRYDDTKQLIEFYDGNDRVLGTQSAADLEGKKVSGINVLNFTTFIPGKVTILSVTVGIEVEGWMTPYYDDTSLVVKAPVQIELSSRNNRTFVNFKIDTWQ